MQALPSLVLSGFRLVRLTLNSDAPTGVEDYLTPEVGPALRFVRVSTSTAYPELLLCASRVCQQLDGLQLDCAGVYGLESSTMDDLFVAYRNVLDRTLFSFLDTFEHASITREMQHFLCPRLFGSDLADQLEDLARGPCTKLKAVFVPRNVVKKPFSRRDSIFDTILLHQITMTGARPVWVDSAEGEYDFILPEFEQYLKAKKQRM